MTDKLKIVYKQTDTLVPYANNPRLHSPEQITEIAAAIKKFGWTRPVLLDGKNGIIAGHGTVMAALKLGESQVPCVELRHLSGAQKRALVIADNRLAEKSSWDPDILAAELQLLEQEDFDIELTGFSDDDLADMLCEGDEHGSTGVKEIETGEVKDEFWLSIRGPLEHQAKVLQALRQATSGMPGVEVELGTIDNAGL